MTALEVIADDLTGACDVGAELAAAGFAVRVAVDGASLDEVEGGVCVVNTQSRAVRAGEAYARVQRVARRRPVDLLLKKIDTALRGHLGAELDAAIDGLGASAAFVVPAIPTAGRVTRGGCQWFSGRRLSETEFASDPEGGGAESSVAAVIGRESRRRTELIGLEILRTGGLRNRTRTLMGAGVDVFIVDAESEDDLATATCDILELPRPLCIVGSIGVAAALAAHLGTADATSRIGLAPLPGPALILCGSMHSTARAQLEGACAAEFAARVTMPQRIAEGIAATDRATIAAQAHALLVSGQSAVVAAPPAEASPDVGRRRAIERTLGEIARDVLRGGAAAALVLIGGETSYAVLRAIGATELVVHGRIAPLVAAGTVARGEAVGLPLIVKGGSGGGPDTLRALLDRTAPAHQAAG
ncbi:MAG: four-carbon acid sugar kinase family protein [Deltaproteobacteria bacterium]|nr:four-carbon acid sugar kinase family protein [Deltaproteobacteria bacterium]